MEKILPQIEKLLASNDHAVIPGLGGFVVQQQSARIAGGIIHPPTANISFNAFMQHTDGMLAVGISRELQINYREAVRLIDNEVAKFMNQLKKNKKAELGHIGVFRMDKEGHLLFTPNATVDFLPENFGVRALRLPNIKAKKSKDIVFTLSSKRIMKSAAVLIILIALVFSSEVNDTRHVIKADFYSLNRVDLPEIIVTPTSAPVIDTFVTDEIPLEEHYSYKVVVAVFQTETHATAYCDKLIAQRFNESEVISGTSNAKVSIRTFTDFDSAVNYMEELRNQDPNFKDAWVMKTKSSS